MKKAIWAFTLLCYAVLWANPDPETSDLRIGSVNGQVIENSSGNPVAFAAIVLKSMEDGSTITGGITKEDGSFELKKLPEGTFRLEVQFIGYKTHSREITISKRNRKRSDSNTKSNSGGIL